MAASGDATRLAPSVPTTMRAAAIDRFGPPDVLALHTLPVPVPGPREVLIELHAAGVGVWDADVRAGTYASGRERFPLVPGADGAGVVVGIGVGVERFRIGHRVWASEFDFDNPTRGFSAEYVVVDADHAGQVPRQLDLRQAGAAAATGLTALQGIHDHLDLHQGETLLIVGASGAVGTLALQFAKYRLARVVATATTSGAEALVRELGADHVIDARRDDAVQQLRALAPEGLDAVLALAGGDALERCLDLVRDGGRVAYPNGVEPAPRQRAGVRLIAYDGVAGPRQFEQLERGVEESHLRVPIAATYPLEKAAEAHARLQRRPVLGRVVLTIRDEETAAAMS
ncbi:MAG: zinc-binding alcohol dehydrogenase family protein [Gemmatimonadaceae bacterium]